MPVVARPGPPFVGWPLQWVTTRGSVWFVPDPPALITQTNGSRVEAQDLEIAHDIIDEIVGLDLLRPGLVAVHDWRTLRSVEPAFAGVWLRRARRPGNPFAVLKAAHVAISGNDLVRTAFQAIASTVQAALRQPPARFVADPAPVLEQLGIRPPPADFLERARQRRSGGGA